MHRPGIADIYKDIFLFEGGDNFISLGMPADINIIGMLIKTKSLR